MHAPIIKEKFNKCKHKLQLWITKGILNAIHTRESLNNAKKEKTQSNEMIEKQYTGYTSAKRDYYSKLGFGWNIFKVKFFHLVKTKYKTSY